MNKPKVIGITGGIGGGKSTLAKILREKGYLVYDTDLEARRLQNENIDIRKHLIHLFGEDIYDNQQLNRKKLAELVFNNPELLLKLNSIIHPVVKNDFINWQKEHSNERYLFIESAVMYESGFDSIIDKVIVVTAPEEVRIARVVKRDNISPEQVRQRIANQMPEEEKIKRADIVLNSNGKNVLKNNIEKLFKEIK